jgi:hypothetical protein
MSDAPLKKSTLLTGYKVLLHCYALDCASHFLLNPGGTDTLNDSEDFKLMQELSYHDSLKREFSFLNLDFHANQ